jgi:hypothetical protein
VNATHRCNKGAACDYDRIFDVKQLDDAVLKQLELCDHHRELVKKDRAGVPYGNPPKWAAASKPTEPTIDGTQPLDAAPKRTRAKVLKT